VLVRLDTHVRVDVGEDGLGGCLRLELLYVVLSKEKLPVEVGLLDEIVVGYCDQT
jgi:hypothetical protein